MARPLHARRQRRGEFDNIRRLSHRIVRQSTERKCVDARIRLAGSVAAFCIATLAMTQTAPSPFGDVAHHVVRVDGLRFHYVTAGSGEPVVLLPGWPEMSWI